MQEKEKEIVCYLKELRAEIIHNFESYEESPEKAFERKSWSYSKGRGGGEMAVMRADTFEKAAVNFSEIQGDSFPMKDSKGAFYATGVSLITHMRNPKLPTVHMNLRFIHTEHDGWWFGGGYDLTPMGFPFPEDTAHFHKTAQEALDAIDPALYVDFSKKATEYFYIPHYQKERGVGGLFFDRLTEDSFEKASSIWRAVGDSFLKAIMPIYDSKKNVDYDQDDRELQLKRRAHYVEFNLLYDRGTKFGFMSGGNPEAILCSMPPLASW